MGKNFFFKMALTNIKRDKKMFFPFTVATTAFVSIYFMVVTVMLSKGIADVPSGPTLQTMFQIGLVVMNLLTVIFMVYINSFLIKRRKKEFGLYGILGLEKRHVGKVILWENFIIMASAILLGVLTGSVFGKLIFMIIFYSLKVSTHSRYIIPWQAFAYTGALFFGIFLLNSTFNLLQVRLANPIDLLKGEHMGEKKVRFILPKTIIGIVLLGWAYYTALSVTHAVSALTQFFIAVIAVIAASYILFEAGSLVFLNRLKKNKNIYYKSRNFIAISGLFHRMKQNAAGLASICILSTMVVITVSTCVSLYLGMDDMLKMRDSNDMEIQLSDKASKEHLKELDTLLQSTAKKYNITIKDQFSYTSISDTLLLKNGEFTHFDPDFYGNQQEYAELEEYIKYVDFLTIEDYNRIFGLKKTLHDKELLLLTRNDFNADSMKRTIAGEYTIKEIIPGTKLIKGKYSEKPGQFFIVTQSKKASEQLIKKIDKDARSIYGSNVTVNMDGSSHDLLQYSKEIVNKANKIKNVQTVKAIATDKEDGYGLYGGLLFLGIFFTILFLVATVLIIYFKQVSEGYDDKERFIILQKVGMDDREVKKTINKQILIIFFLPLAGALLHVAAARNMIIKMLEAFYLYDIALTTWCIVITGFVFALVYVFVFRVTAKTYYKIVKW